MYQQHVELICWWFLFVFMERDAWQRDEGEQAKQMQQNRYTVKTNKKQLNAICGGRSLFCGAPTLLSHREGNTVVCMATIHLPVCLYALLTTCGDAPDGLQMVSRDLLPDLHRYITSHRGSTGLRSVEPEGTNAFIIEELFHTGHMRLAIVLHQDEPRAEC